MYDAEYRMDMTLKLKPEVTMEEAEKLADELFQNTLMEIAHEIGVTRVDGCYAVNIDDAIFTDDNFEDTLENSGMLPKMQDQEFHFTGDGQLYFERIHDGRLEWCGTIQQPDNQWQPFRVPEGEK